MKPNQYWEAVIDPKGTAVDFKPIELEWEARVVARPDENYVSAPERRLVGRWEPAPEEDET